jgi:hypothetical protein
MKDEEESNMDGNTIEMAAERLKLWGDVLTTLGREDVVPKLIPILEAGDRKGLEDLFDMLDVKLFQIGVCIDIVDTITKVINFGPGHYEDQCEIVHRLFVEPISDTNGRIYQLPDGSFVFVSDRQWVDYATRAQTDAIWRDQNKAFLKAIGVLRCHKVLVSDSQLVTLNTSKTMCFPTVISP